MLKTFTVFSVMATASVLASSPLLSYISITDDTAYGLKRMYLSAGKFRQNQWNRFIDIVGDDFSNLFTYGKSGARQKDFKKI